MTTFADLQTLTIDETRRPELVSLTKSAIRLATTRAHRVASFPRDNRVYQHTYTPGAQSAQFVDVQNIYSLMPLLRTVQFCQCIDPTSGLPVENLEARDTADVFDKHGVVRQSIYTIMGDTLRIYPLIQSGILNIYHFQDPDVSDTSYSSWIADKYPEELAKWAASIIQVRTGSMDIAKINLQTNVQPFKELLISAHMQNTVS